MVFLPNPPEADKSLRYALKNNPQNINYMLAVIFFACLDLEQKSSFMDGNQLKITCLSFNLLTNLIPLGSLICSFHA